MSMRCKRVRRPEPRSLVELWGEKPPKRSRNELQLHSDDRDGVGHTQTKRQRPNILEPFMVLPAHGTHHLKTSSLQLQHATGSNVDVDTDQYQLLKPSNEYQDSDVKAESEKEPEPKPGPKPTPTPKPKRQKLAIHDPRRKRAYKARGPIKKRKHGELKKLLEMPFDILCEVFSHLHPLDLLHLSRTSKAIRSTLLNRSTSISIWRRSLQALRVSAECKNGSVSRRELPACPDDMSEPAFVNMMFGKNCDFCLRSLPGRSLNREYRMRIKICGRCLLSECLVTDDEGVFEGDGEYDAKPTYNGLESRGYPKKLWDERPALDMKPNGIVRQAIPSGLHKCWARGYEEAKDQDAWLAETLREQRAANQFHNDCVDWFEEYNGVPIHLRRNPGAYESSDSSDSA